MTSGQALNGIAKIFTLLLLLSLTTAFYYYFQHPFLEGNEAIKQKMYQHLMVFFGSILLLFFLGFIRWALAKQRY